LLECVAALETLAVFNFEFGHGRKAAESIAYNAENFFEIALWYGRKNIANAVLKTYEKALNACYEEGNLTFPFGRTVLRKSIRKVKRLLDEEQPQWVHQSRRIDRFVKN